MSPAQVISAWKDPVYRASLHPDVLATLPLHPAGTIEVAERSLGLTPGGITHGTAGSHAGSRGFWFLLSYHYCSAYGDNLWLSEFTLD